MSGDSSKSMIMELATNSVRNTTLATANDDPYYEIVTRFWHPHLTKINKLDPASRKMTTVCEIDNTEKEAKIRFADENKKGKSAKDSLGEWVSSEAILKLAPKKPWDVLFSRDRPESYTSPGEAFSSIPTASSFDGKPIIATFS